MPYKDPEKKRARAKVWRLANLEELRAADRAYNKANPEKAIIRAKAWVKANPERLRERKRAHPEKNRAYNKRARAKALATDPETFYVMERARSHRRRARELGRGGGWTFQEWIALKAQYDNRCLACHKTEVELLTIGRLLVPDHIQALATGGRNIIENLQPLCHGTGGCNNSKQTFHVDYRGPAGPIPYDTLEMSKVRISVPMEA
jgi:hypothetical protein